MSAESATYIRELELNVRRLARERDEARAEAERQRRDLLMLDEHRTFRDALRATAQRQREACAKAVLADYAAGELTPAAVTRACRIIQQTPLVTEGES